MLYSGGTFVVRKQEVAKALCVKYGFFDDLVARKIDRDDETKHVYLFKKTPEIEVAFKKVNNEINAEWRRNCDSIRTTD